MVTKECNKICFDTEKEAKIELERIVNSNDYRNWKQVSPHRLYMCPACNCWHLTSKPFIIEY